MASARPGQAGYASAKAALKTYSRTLAAEVAPSGVRVVNVLPDFIPTGGAITYTTRWPRAEVSRGYSSRYSK